MSSASNFTVFLTFFVVTENPYVFYDEVNKACQIQIKTDKLQLILLSESD